MSLKSAKKSETELNQLFHIDHKVGETCRITISLFAQHYGLAPIQQEIAAKIAKILVKNGLKHLDDFMITMTPVLSKDQMDDIPNAKPKDLRGLKIKQ